MSLFAPPPDVATEVFASVPDDLRRRGQRCEWGESNKRGEPVDCFLEGPSFDREGNLWLVDIAYGRILKVSPSGDFTVVAEYDGWPNGLKIHRDGRIFVTDYRRGIVRVDPVSGEVTTVVGHRNTEGFKGVNDLFFASNGDLYFTDQGQTGMHDPTGRVYRVPADALDDRPVRLEQLVGTVPSPNGLVMNPAETILYVAVTRMNNVWRVPIMPDGSPSKVGVFVQLSGGLGGPDGMAVDRDGNLAVCHAGMGSVWLFSRLGEPLARIRSCTGLTTTNCAYGGADGRDLYITESETGTVLRARLDVPGEPMFARREDPADRW
ncbi:MAG: SMP-30/gluconolactonase/LRE family protein [Ectothiorhodospiraceae bacterium]|nr:SMP-30/gluconolactonase/LRE family protein [Chromatiales bacterium]MCP5156962.1 SMP-30/gluconolactonase/LRE family protein [Ectothiorhodospiraceae bacterium]